MEQQDEVAVLATIFFTSVGTWLLWTASAYLIEGKPLPAGTRPVLPGPYAQSATAIFNIGVGLVFLWLPTRVAPLEIFVVSVVFNGGIIGFRIQRALTRAMRNDHTGTKERKRRNPK